MPADTTTLRVAFLIECDSRYCSNPAYARENGHWYCTECHSDAWTDRDGDV